MLLNQPDPTTITTNHTFTSTTTTDNQPNPLHPDLLHNQTSALIVAAQNGHTECVKLLLSAGTPADVSDENGFTPLHCAAAHGRTSCVETLLSAGAAVDSVLARGQTSLFLACEAGKLDCARVLLRAGADRSLTTADGCTALHAAVRSGHVDTLRLVLNPSVALAPACPAALGLPAALLNHTNSDGWTTAHMAAALGLKECLEVLCSYSEQDIDRRDNCNRTIHDVATDDCKDLLENLSTYLVAVRLQFSGGGLGLMCPVDSLEEEANKGFSGNSLVLGRVSVHRAMQWTELSAAIGHVFTSYLGILCGGSQLVREEKPQQRPPLGLSPNSITSICIEPERDMNRMLEADWAKILSTMICFSQSHGDTECVSGQEPPLSPWDLLRKPFGQGISVRLKGLSESCLDELALQTLLPLPLLQNCVRLVEQYRNLIFHGLEGSCQEHIATLVSHCLKSKQEAGGLGCDVVRVEVEESLTKEQLLEIFITCGFLVPVLGAGREVMVTRCVVVLLEGLEKASSLSGLLGDLCHSLDNRGCTSPLVLNTGPHYFSEGNFLIATLSKPRLQGSELRLQQHFRWVTLRWDQEPLHGLLGRHLRRKLLHKRGTGDWSPDDVTERSMLWVGHVWQQLNACLSRLGTHEALLGPQLFLSCPVIPNNCQTTVRWLARLWNAVLVPRVEEAIISRVTAKRSSSSSTMSPSCPRAESPCSRKLSAGQQAVVKAALSILLNKAVLPGCPLPRHEMDRYLLEFQGGTFPLSAIGSYKGGGANVGGRRGRDGGKLRRSNTSPRKKENWSSGGSFREGSLSSTDVSFITNGKLQRPAGLSLFSDDETDLIRELQKLCTSKSEPDITKAKDHLILFSGPSTEELLPQEPHVDTAVHQRAPAAVSSSNPAADPSRDPRSGSGSRSRSQLPVPSRGQQPRVYPPCNNNINSSSSSSSIQETSTHSSSNNYHNINDNHHLVEDIWILHRDVHENNNH